MTHGLWATGLAPKPSLEDSPPVLTAPAPAFSQDTHLLTDGWGWGLTETLQWKRKIETKSSSREFLGSSVRAQVGLPRAPTAWPGLSTLAMAPVELWTKPWGVRRPEIRSQLFLSVPVPVTCPAPPQWASGLLSHRVKQPASTMQPDDPTSP